MVKGEKPHSQEQLFGAGCSSPERDTVASGDAASQCVCFHWFSFHLTDRNPVTPAPDPRLPPQSCLLLPPTPVRGGQKAVVSKKTNMHIFIESGLRVRINRK